MPHRVVFARCLCWPMAVVVAASLAAWSAPVAAQTAADPGAQTSSLSWSRLAGAEPCIGPRELARSVETLLRRSVFVSAAQADVSVEGRVGPADPDAAAGSAKPPPRWQAVLTMSDAEGKVLGTREIASVAESCRELDDSVALAVALMIDPEAALGGGPDGPPLPEKPPPVRVIEKPVLVPVPVDRPVPVPVPPQEDEDSWHWAVRLSPVIGLGLLPDVAWGLQVAVNVEPPWFLAVEGSANAYLESAAEGDGARGDFLLLHFNGAVCPVTLRALSGDLVFSTCVELQLGGIWADGTNLEGDWDDSQFVCNVASRLRLTYRVVGPLTIGAGFAGAIALVRERFLYRDPAGQEQELYRMSPLSAQPDVSLGLQFP